MCVICQSLLVLILKGFKIRLWTIASLRLDPNSYGLQPCLGLDTTPGRLLL